jgi:DNA-binding transcriptional ArsR family regulator
MFYATTIIAGNDMRRRQVSTPREPSICTIEHVCMCLCNYVCMTHGHDVDLAYLSSDTARLVAATMQALATPSRVRILSRLGAGPCSVNELARDVEMEQPAVSQQLRVLRHLGLVVGDRQGRQIIYALHDDHVAVLLAEAVSHVEHLRLGIVGRPAREAVGA